MGIVHPRSAGGNPGLQDRPSIATQAQPGDPIALEWFRLWLRAVAERRWVDAEAARKGLLGRGVVIAPRAGRRP